MKAVIIVLVIVGAIALFFHFRKNDTPTAGATLQVGLENIIQEFEKIAGRNKVAVKLMGEALDDRKERLVKIKTIKNTLTRRTDELEAEAKQFDQDGKPELAKQKREMVTDYSTRLASLSTQEAEATVSLQKCADDYEKFKSEIEAITEKIAVEKAVGGLSDDLSVGSPIAAKLEAARRLKAELLLELDRAKALTEVNKLETGPTK